MSNVPNIICKRLCTHNKFGRCNKPREWRRIGDDAPWGQYYCVDREPETCKDFEFDSNKIPQCIDCVICENRYLWPGIQVCKNYERKWWKFWRPK